MSVLIQTLRERQEWVEQQKSSKASNIVRTSLEYTLLVGSIVALWAWHQQILVACSKLAEAVKALC